MFYPGETIEHRFVIPFDKDEIDYVIISYKQKQHIVLEKKIISFSDGPEFKKSVVIVSFSETDSLQFMDECPYSIQLNVYTKGNSNRFTSNPIGNPTCGTSSRTYSGSQYYREVKNNA